MGEHTFNVTHILVPLWHITVESVLEDLVCSLIWAHLGNQSKRPSKP